MEILKTINLKKIYKDGDLEVRALDKINISIPKGEFISIVGTSGSGKSTLLKMLGGLETPTSGEVLVQNHLLSQMTEDERSRFRRRNVGFVFQHFNLLDTLNIYENIMFPLRLDGENVEQGFVGKIVVSLGLADKLMQMPDQLSGGQQQRVAIARALVAKPAIILADEPTGNLDSQTTVEVMVLFREMAKEFNQTMIIVTHDLRVAEMASRMIQIKDGKIYSERYL
ncbi:MAG: ABC transporter ATP-binding protein [Lachnospiraceae bacterium]|nr:ABC transporter ATP-binding protein [Lachnospiraceae bacterium]